LEGLPEGEVLSPLRDQPQVHREESSKIAAGVPFSEQMPQAFASGLAEGGGIDFDGWDADADSDWNIS
jgi:hypothetical protein